MPNPNQPNYGRLQINTPQVNVAESKTQVEAGRDNVGGTQGGGFKFAADARGAYNVPDTLLGAVTRNAGSVAQSAQQMMDTSKQWAVDTDNVMLKDMEAEAERIKHSDLYMAADETGRANMINDHYATYDDYFITDDYKRSQKVRRYQSNAYVDIAQGMDTATAFARAMRETEDLPSSERVEVLEQYKAAAGDIIDPRMRDQFDISIRNARAGITADWQRKNVEAVEGFRAWLGVHFKTNEQIAAAGVTTRDAFISSQTAAYIDTFQGADDQQRAIAQQMLESLAGDQYDRAQFATGREMSFEKSQLVTSGVARRDKTQVMPVLREQSAMKGLSVLTQAMSQATFETSDDAATYGTGIAAELFAENPALMQDFLRQIPDLPEGLDPRFSQLHAAAQGDEATFNGALDAADGDVFTLVTEMYGHRAAAAIAGKSTGDGGRVGGAPVDAATKQRAAVNSQYAGAEAQVRAALDIPEGKTVPSELVTQQIMEDTALPGAGLAIPVSGDFNRETIPSLMNATASLPASPVKEANIRSLEAADAAVGRWFERMVEKGEASTIATLLPVYEQYRASEMIKFIPGQTSANIQSNTLAPGSLASMIDDLPDNVFTKELRASVVGTMEGRHEAMVKSEYYDENTGFRVTLSHDDAGTFATDYASRTYSDLPSAKQNNYYKATSAAFSAVRTGDPLFTNTEEGYTLNQDVLAANDQLKYIIPSLSMQMEANGTNPGVRALTDEMITSIYPAHIAELYTHGSPSLRTAIRSMTVGFFQNAQDLNEAGPFISSFEDRLDSLMIASHDPTVRTEGLNRIGSVTNLAASVVTPDALAKLGGRSTMQESSRQHGWLSAGPRDYGTKNFSDDSYYAMLDTRYPDLKGQPENQEIRFAKDIDMQVSGELVEFALDDPDFRDTLMTELAGNPAPADQVLAAALASWKSDNDLLITILPNDPLVSPTIVESGATAGLFGTTSEGQLFTEMSAKTSTGLKFAVTRLPRTDAIGSMRLVDGSSQYSDALNANVVDLANGWGNNPGLAEATAFTNAASRSFLEQDIVNNINTEFLNAMSSHLGPQANVQGHAAIMEYLNGSEMSTPHVMTPGSLDEGVDPSTLAGGGEKWKYMHSLGVDPSLPKEDRAAYRQYSAERALGVLTVMQGVKNGQLTVESVQQLHRTLQTFLPTANTDSQDEIRRSLFRLVEERGFNPRVEVRTATGDLVTIENPAVIAQMKRYANSGSEQPVAYKP